ncbi:MAG: RagB/SusD family nutrient uptake outer membrane protein [Bacteroidia bacterium]|nr:RagB/SusD family nutrient uptake outer membrane protein [Bacteroidia bacterium]
MRILRNAFTALALFLTTGLYWGCSDDFLNTTDVNTINSESFYTNAEEAIKAVNAVYAGLQRQGLYQRQIFFVLDFSSGEAAPTPNTQTPNTQLLAYAFDATHEHINAFWNDSYVTIARANVALEKIPAIEGMDETLRKRLLAEARFLRALSYFNLVSNFGGVPLRIDPSTALVKDLARATPAEVYAVIEEDLRYAESNLPKRSEYDAPNAGRATSGAASALLGKVFVYQQKWGDAEAKLQSVVTSGEYALVEYGRLQSTFNANDENNEESLFEVQFTKNLSGGGGAWAVDVNTGWGGNAEGNFRPKEYGVSGFAFYNAKPSDDLIGSYDPADPRLKAFFFGPGSTFNGQPYDPIFTANGWAIGKYTDPAPGPGGALDDGDINIRVLRYADVLLLLAESKIRLNKMGEAVALINQVRRRADPSGAILPDRAADGNELQHLVTERKLELCFEGQRRLDVVRWGLGPQVFGSKFVTGKHEVLPIPANEVDINKLCTQNPGY